MSLLSTSNKIVVKRTFEESFTLFGLTTSSVRVCTTVHLDSLSFPPGTTFDTTRRVSGRSSCYVFRSSTTLIVDDHQVST